MSIKTTITTPDVAGVPPAPPEAHQRAGWRKVIEQVFDVAKSVPIRMAEPGRRALRRLGVSDQVLREAERRRVLTFLAADAGWNREHFAFAGIDPDVAWSLSIRPIVFSPVERNVLTGYQVRKLGDTHASTLLNRTVSPLIWYGEAAATAIVRNPLEGLLLLSSGWQGHVMAIPAGKWIPWWARLGAIRRTGRVIVMDEVQSVLANMRDRRGVQ